jgi:ParB-like chromosome segregation protein Spo0J
MDKMQFHALAEIFPLIKGDEFEELCADIKAHGLREPIVTFENKILDGRNRFRACTAVGSNRGLTHTLAIQVSLLISLDLERRHLSASQRALIAARLANLKLGHVATQALKSIKKQMMLEIEHQS